MHEYIVTVWLENEGQTVYLVKYLVDATDHKDAERRVREHTAVANCAQLETQLVVCEGGMCLIHMQ